MGAKFVAQIRLVLERIAADPQRQVAIYHGIRKAIVPKFPYVILYREAPGEVLVISVFHTSRDPSAWKSRA